MLKQFADAGFMADADLDAGCLLNKKIRNAQLAQYNFILGEITLALRCLRLLKARFGCFFSLFGPKSRMLLLPFFHCNVLRGENISKQFDSAKQEFSSTEQAA